MISLFSLALMLSLTTSAPAQTWIVIANGPTVRLIQGVVIDATDFPYEGMVVELYDNPDVILKPGPGWEGKQHKIASATTDRNGKFKFPKVRPGKYEVRVTPDLRVGTNQKSVIVKVRRCWFWPLGRGLRIRIDSFM